MAKSKFQCTCLKPPLMMQWNNRWSFAVKQSSCETTAVRHPGLAVETSEMRALAKERFKANHNQIPQWRLKRLAKLMKSNDNVNCWNFRDKLPNFWKTLKAKCRDPEDWHTTKCRWNLERGTPAVAPTQPYSSEAPQALLLEKSFTNCFAVDNNGSEEIDQPMHSFGKRWDRCALGFKTCAMGRLASINSSMISELSSDKQNFPLITERSAASFPFGPVRWVVIRTNCTGRPLCPVARITFSKFREEDSMWLQITKWIGRSDCWHKYSQRSLVPVRNLPVRVHSFSAPNFDAVGVKHLMPTLIKNVWSADHRNDFTLECSFAGIRSEVRKPKGSVTAGSTEKGSALYHWGPEKRYGSTPDADATARLTRLVLDWSLAVLKRKMLQNRP